MASVPPSVGLIKTKGADQLTGVKSVNKAEQIGLVQGWWWRVELSSEKPKEEGRHPDATLGVRLRGTCLLEPRPHGGSFLLWLCVLFHTLAPLAILRGRLPPPSKSSG